MSSLPNHNQLLQKFATSCHRVAEAGLVHASAGNLSLRLNHETMLISGSGAWLAEMTPEQVSVCRITDLQHMEGIKPSMEAGFHGHTLQQRPELATVLHFQSINATAISCLDAPLPDFNVIPEVPYYIGPVTILDYLEPGSTELAEAASAALMHHDLILLRNHGQITVGRTFQEALQRAIFFELACSMIMTDCQGVKAMSGDDAARLIARREQGV